MHHAEYTLPAISAQKTGDASICLRDRIENTQPTANTACPHRVSEQKFHHEAASRLKSLTGNSRLNNIYH